MKVLRKRDLRKVGKRGEVVEVSDGYGANYIIPMGYGVLLISQRNKQKKRKSMTKKSSRPKRLPKRGKQSLWNSQHPLDGMETGLVQFLSKRQVKPGKNNTESTSAKTGLLTKMFLSMALD